MIKFDKKTNIYSSILQLRRYKKRYIGYLIDSSHIL